MYAAWCVLVLPIPQFPGLPRSNLPLSLGRSFEQRKLLHKVAKPRESKVPRTAHTGAPRFSSYFRGKNHPAVHPSTLHPVSILSLLLWQFKTTFRTDMCVSHLLWSDTVTLR